MLEFWMSVGNFKRRSKASKVDRASLQDDAIHIYEKYVSLQAPDSLGFGADMRFVAVIPSYCLFAGHVDDRQVCTVAS